jgi:hypothetical protein
LKTLSFAKTGFSHAVSGLVIIAKTSSIINGKSETDGMIAGIEGAL